MFSLALNSPSADFWIQRNGSETTVGQPSRRYRADWFGVTVDRQQLLPEFFWYFVQYSHQAGHFRPHAHGSIALKHLRSGDVRAVLHEQAALAWAPEKLAQVQYVGSWFAHSRRPDVAAGILAESQAFFAHLAGQRRQRLSAKRHRIGQNLITERAV